jgi:FixJ family two-component response regulator
MARPLPPVETTTVVFVAEDDAEFRIALGETLAEAGFSVVLFPNAETLVRSLAGTIPR